MSINRVGYKLVNSQDNSVITTWGGIWGQCPGIPDLIVLPNNDRIYAPKIDEDYQGYKLIEWEMEQPLPKVPDSVPLWAVRVILTEKGLFDAATTAIAVSNNSALQTIWEYGNFVDSSSPALKSLATQLNISDDELNLMLLEASNLKI